MDYRESVEYLLSFADFERSGRFRERPDVAPVLALLRRLGDPHLALPAGRKGRTTVHIAGSKGKGSVAAMVDSVLQAAGHGTGLFTSPHLHSYTERIRINGEPLAEDDWARLTGVLRKAVAGAETEGRSLVTFDLLTALAFLAFREMAVRCQVLEVGLGGRVDSTNVFQPRLSQPAEAGPSQEFAHVCAITAIGLEHTDVLGDTVDAIAGEKAGIITPGADVVIGPQQDAAAREVLLRAAEGAGCPIVDVGADYAWRLVSHDLEGQTFDLRRPAGALRLRIPLLGGHQMENAATAVACADALRGHGLDVPDGAIERGLADVRWPARFEILRKSPEVIADGAHNRDSARYLRETLTRYLSCDGAFLIIGMSVGKDVTGLAEELAPVASGVVAVRADHPRAMPPQEVAAAFRRAGVEVKVGQGVAAALDGALAAAAGDGVICLAGSLFVAAEGRAHLRGLAASV